MRHSLTHGTVASWCAWLHMLMDGCVLNSLGQFVGILRTFEHGFRAGVSAQRRVLLFCGRKTRCGVSRHGFGNAVAVAAADEKLPCLQRTEECGWRRRRSCGAFSSI